MNYSQCQWLLENTPRFDPSKPPADNIHSEILSESPHEWLEVEMVIQRPIDLIWYVLLETDRYAYWIAGGSNPVCDPMPNPFGIGELIKGAKVGRVIECEFSVTNRRYTYSLAGMFEMSFLLKQRSEVESELTARFSTRGPEDTVPLHTRVLDFVFSSDHKLDRHEGIYAGNLCRLAREIMSAAARLQRESIDYNGLVKKDEAGSVLSYLERLAIKEDLDDVEKIEVVSSKYSHDEEYVFEFKRV